MTKRDGREAGTARASGPGPAPPETAPLMGPFYHLTESADRAAALGEARRVLGVAARG